MTRRFEAFFENGVLRPAESIEGFTENQRVTVTVEAVQPSSPFAGWVGDVSDDDARRMRDAIEAEFEQVEHAPSPLPSPGVPGEGAMQSCSDARLSFGFIPAAAIARVVPPSP